MRVRATAGAFVAAGYVFGSGMICLLSASSAHAAQAYPRVHRPPTHILHVAARNASWHRPFGHAVLWRHQSQYRGGGLQCVTFARAASGIELSGNAVDWWYNAAGIYQRGDRPEPGSVLNFRANGRMRLGHVAVVTRVLSAREIEVDQANWAYGPYGRGAITRGVHVVDVSPDNDWSAVRVELGRTEDFGSIYPTYGFIYNRPDGAPAPLLVQAAAAPLPGLNPAPSDLRPMRDRATAPLPVRGFDQVAEAPDDGTVQRAGLTFDAPDRNLR